MIKKYIHFPKVDVFVFKKTTDKDDISISKNNFLTRVDNTFLSFENKDLQLELNNLSFKILFQMKV